MKNFMKYIPIILASIAVVLNVILIIRGLLPIGVSPSEEERKEFKEMNRIPSDILLIPDTVKFNLSRMEKDLNAYTKRVDQQKQFFHQSIVNSQNSRMQTRLAFIALLAAVFIAAFATKDTNTGRQGAIVVVSYLLFMSFYFFDIHTVDVQIRQKHRSASYAKTSYFIIKIQPEDSIMYTLNDTVPTSFMNDMDKNPKKRKLKSALNPDLSQVSFYIAPMTFLLGLYLFSIVITLKE